jgi:hypothetical protein
MTERGRQHTLAAAFFWRTKTMRFERRLSPAFVTIAAAIAASWFIALITIWVMR